MSTYKELKKLVVSGMKRKNSIDSNKSDSDDN